MKMKDSDYSEEDSEQSMWDDDASTDDEPLSKRKARSKVVTDETKSNTERTIILMPIMKIEFTEFKPAHMKKHGPTYKDMDSGKKNQFCSMCNEYFNRAPGHPRNMHNHILEVHTETLADGTLKCNVCSKISSSKMMVRRHFDQSHRMFEKPKICHICGEELLFYGTYSKHYQSHKEKEKLEKGEADKRECAECNIQFTTNAAYYCHKKSFHSDSRVQCEICSKIFRNIQQLRVHKVQAHLEKRFVCEFCDWRYSYKYMIKDHIKKRHSEYFSSMDFSDIKRGRQSKDKLAKALMAGTVQVNGQIEPGLQGVPQGQPKLDTYFSNVQPLSTTVEVQNFRYTNSLRSRDVHFLE